MQAIHFHHIDADQAERYLMGDSPEEETADWEEHLLLCARCRARISNVDVYVSSMSDAAGELRGWTVTQIEGGWQLSRVLSAAAAVACVLSLAILALWYYGLRSR